MGRCPRCEGKLFDDPDGRVYCHMCGRAVEYREEWFVIAPQPDIVEYGEVDPARKYAAAQSRKRTYHRATKEESE